MSIASMHYRNSNTFRRDFHDAIQEDTKQVGPCLSDSNMSPVLSEGKGVSEITGL